MSPHVRWFEWLFMAAASAGLAGLAAAGHLRRDEVFGFVTGGVCVWLVVRQHILNFPFGLANNVGFFVLFFRSRLYADMGLQVVFFALGVIGWWNWARGRGPNARPPLVPTHAGWKELLAVGAFVGAATVGLRELLLWANGAAPFWDSHTTALSLAAQYLLIRKRIENWYLWIAADVIYIPLYLSRDLPLTALLYAVFLVMCVVGLIQWWAAKRRPSRMSFDTGVVIGKFYPPHHGHHFLIERALRDAAHVTGVVCGKPTDAIPPELRGEWLRQVHPTATVLVIDDRYDENDSRVWAENTIRWLGGPPDAVFTSEDYGDAYAAHMGSVHVPVDKARTAVPCSGTMIRSDPFAHWEFLAPPVRGWFAKRVCVIGAESTGTTTLAEQLAEALGTVWVPEYGREYSALKQNRGETEWHSDEFVAIAMEQTRRENEAAGRANRVLVCDTNAFATVHWHRRYLGTSDPRVRAVADAGRCDLYLLTGDEIPFVQDGLRDGEAIRHAMHGWFAEALAAQPVPWVLVRGNCEERLSQALTAVARLFDGSAWRPGHRYPSTGND